MPLKVRGFFGFAAGGPTAFALGRPSGSTFGFTDLSSILSNALLIPRRPLANCLGFVRATKRDALALIHERGLPADYMADHATRRLMVVPDREMEDFRRVCDLSIEGPTAEKPLALGAAVRVIKGPLTGVGGRVLGESGKWYVVVELLGMFYARARVPQAWLEVEE